MAESETQDDEPHWSVTESPDEWVNTGHDGVFGRNGSDAQYTNNSVYEFADRFPDHTIVVTGGPYRSHDVQYRIPDDDVDVIHLDFYSVQPGYDRLDEVAETIEATFSLPEGEDAHGYEPFAYPGYEWLKTTGDKIEQGMRVSGPDAGTVLYVSAKPDPIELGDEEILIAPLVIEQINSNLFGRVKPFDSSRIDPPETVEDVADFSAAQVYRPDEKYWTLHPTADAEDEDDSE